MTSPGRLAALATAALLLPWAGCSSDGDDPGSGAAPSTPATTSTGSAPSSAPSSGSTSAAPDTSPEAARAAYAAALEELRTADTGHVEAQGSLSADFGVRLSEDYRLSDASSRGTVQAGALPGLEGAPQAFAAAASLGGSGWFRATDEDGAPAASCWTAFSSGEALPRDEPLRLAPLGFPAAVEVLASGTGVLRTGSELRVEVDLYRLGLVYGPGIPAILGLERDGQGVATIIVILDDDGRIESWRTSDGDFLRAVEEAGITLPPELEDYRSQAMSTVGAELTRVGGPVDVAPPPPAERCASS